MAVPLMGPVGMLLLAVLSFGLLFALAVLWWRTWRETRSAFSLGLVLFAGILALQEVLRLVAMTSRAARAPPPVDLRALEFFGAFGQVVALGILLYFVAR